MTEKRNADALLGPRAVSTARAALGEIAEGGVGEHIGVAGVSRNVATHRFVADVPGYPGWEWNAVVACATGSTWVTVNEVALVPSPSGEALEAPQWVPYAERLRPGDLRPGDLLEPAPDDPRLTDDSFDRDAVTLPGRETRKYLTRAGLDEARRRWRTGDYGPNSEFAAQAQLKCRSCAFFLPFGEPVGDNFGACCNEFSADGRVVSASYGCGAHSDTRVPAPHAGADEFFDDEKPLF
ncbi:hypothetical protein CAPI_07700 [Corynebacterium capitovis DSM 44611]|uniref:DUF3027 domain-containing protein n=1 Tax=Corynebacterium capitovis TaxID=131081 RepID=UPI00036A0AAD|nr:DUF3027 domain-containing protein [Corynebacterium capitovis]WKD58076.1 hypothetical protein CAPI_07700 [Corynebacterium capitovis DSM 44611]